MRLLFEKGFAPTHAFSAFYRYLREDFGAHAVLHFGTHGALEFMPGKQSGLSAACWPDRLIGDLPNIYLYAANNPSEGTIAKRRSAATLISYLTPPVAHAGLYRGLLDLKASIERWRGLTPDAEVSERAALAALIQAQAAALDLATAEPAWDRDAEGHVVRLGEAILELEYTLIPHGLHVVGQAASPEERIDLLLSIAEAAHGARPERAAIAALVDGRTPEIALTLAGPMAGDPTLAMLRELAATDGLLAEDHEIAGILQRAGWPLHPPGSRRRRAAHPGGAADRPQPARLRPLPHPQRLRRPGRRQAGRPPARPPPGRRPSPSGDRSRSCCGAPTT